RDPRRRSRTPARHHLEEHDRLSLGAGRRAGDRQSFDRARSTSLSRSAGDRRRVVMNRITTAALAVCAVCALASRAEAGGFYLGDIGARGMARGGAFVAAPDDLLAIHYNTAG